MAKPKRSTKNLAYKIKHSSLKRKLLILLLIPFILYVLLVFVAVGVNSIQCGYFDLNIISIEPGSGPDCTEPLQDERRDHDEFSYILKSFANEDYDPRHQAGDYTLRISYPILSSDPNEPPHADVNIQVRPTHSKPLTDGEKSYVNSGKRACGETVFTQPGLEGGVYLYQIRRPRYIYTVTHDNQQNDADHKQKGREILDTLLATIRCKD